VRFYSLCLLMLVLFVASLAMLSQAQETKTMQQKCPRGYSLKRHCGS
jgi:hypothetical protein